MVSFDNVAFNIAAFIGGLFVLEFGADKFIDHTAKLAARTRIPPTLIALLTAGAEWEELVVVIASISQSQSPLALGNIIGSSLSNILGAFSLGLIFSPQIVTFDASAKVYTAALFGVTTFFSLFVLLFEPLGRFGGVLLIATFMAYTGTLGWAVYRGLVTPPVDSDSDSDDDSDSDASSRSGAGLDSDSETEVDSTTLSRLSTTDEKQAHQRCRPSLDIELGGPPQALEEVPLAKELFDDALPLSPSLPLSSQLPYHPGHKAAKTTLHHLTHLLLGLLALILSGYLLSHALITLAASLSLSTSVLGTTVLALATTLPEKLVAIFSARAGQSGIVVANTVGSNIFLLTLCAGVLFTTGDLASLRGATMWWEVLAMWASSALLFAVVMWGGRRWVGWVMFAAYVAFIALEFVLGRGDALVDP